MNGLKKRMQQQFARDIEKKDKSNTWRWMRKSDLKGCTKSLICSSLIYVVIIKQN